MHAPSRAQDVSVDGQVRYEHGVRLLEGGQYRAALEAFSAPADGAEPSLARLALIGRVRAALRLAEFQLARREADRLLRTGEDDPDVLALYGEALWATGMFDEADRFYDAALARKAATARALFGKARSLASVSRFDDALDRVEAALAVAPGDADLHGLRAWIYEQQNRFRPAADAYDEYARRLRRIDPAGAGIARGLAGFLRSFGDRTPRAIRDGGAGPKAIPFRLVRNKVVLRGRINGTAVDWVLDTGAERTGISTDLARRSGVSLVSSTIAAGVGRQALRRSLLGRADRIEVGPLRVDNVPLSVRDPAYGGLPRWLGETLSPLALGLSAVIDYPRRVVVLARSLDALDTGGASSIVRLPLRVFRLPLVRGTLNGTHAVPFVLDTGGEVISISTDTAARLGMPEGRRIRLRVVGLSGTDDDAYLLPGVDVAFEQVAYRQTGVAVLNLRGPSVLLGFELGGIAGHRLLGGYRLSIDLGRSEVRLEK